MASEVTVTDAVAANEIMRLRMKARENNVIFTLTSGHGPPL
jgi:hypothetical protein